MSRIPKGEFIVVGLRREAREISQEKQLEVMRERKIQIQCYPL